MIVDLPGRVTRWRWGHDRTATDDPPFRTVSHDFPPEASTQPVAPPDPVTRAMVHARTRELAAQAGFAPPYVRQSHYEQAKRELTGESDLDRQNAVLDGLVTAPGPAQATKPGSFHDAADRVPPDTPRPPI